MSGESAVCVRCGAVLRPTLRFCTECGQIIAPVATYAELVRPSARSQAPFQATLVRPAPTEGATEPPALVPPPVSGGARGIWRGTTGGIAIFLAVIVLLVAAAGIGAAFRDSSEPLPFVAAALARDSTPDFVPVDQTDSFAPSAEVFHLTFFVTGAEPEDRLTAKWVAVDVGDAAPRNTLIDEATIVLASRDESGAFRLQRGANTWPAGNYRVELYVNDRLAQTKRFTVEP